MWGGQDRSGARKPYGNSMQNLPAHIGRRSPSPPRNRGFRPENNNSNNYYGVDNAIIQQEKERRWALIKARGPISSEDLHLLHEANAGHWKPSVTFENQERYRKEEEEKREQMRLANVIRQQEANAKIRERERIERERNCKVHWWNPYGKCYVCLKEGVPGCLGDQIREMRELRKICKLIAPMGGFFLRQIYEDCSAPDMDLVIRECVSVICENENELRIMNFA